LVRAVDTILRKHGKNIIGKQFATSRLAAIMGDMFVLACVLSRVSQALEEKGTEGAKNEVAILKTFAFQAKRRMRENYKQIDMNVDEEIKELADFVTNEEKFTWDIL
jgi:acyl-CoA dehydrogenase family protein 9